MWAKISSFILQKRWHLLILLLLINVFFIYQAIQVKMDYGFVISIPEDDADMAYFRQFTQNFGQDDNLMIIGLEDEQLFELDKFKAFKKLSDTIKSLKGVNNVLALPNLPYLRKDTNKRKLELKNLFAPFPDMQEALDSLLKFAFQQKIYENILWNPLNKANLMVLHIDKEVLDTAYRQILVNRVINLCDKFSERTEIKLHYTGLPYIRTYLTEQLGEELAFFLLLSFLGTILILLLLYRNIISIIFPLCIIFLSVFWCFGLMHLFSYQINILTSLLPPILVVVGIPNTVYMLNKYHQNYETLGEKEAALRLTIQKIGLVALTTNLTTACGFAVVILVNNVYLQQFALIAALSVLAVFLNGIILFPIVHSFLPPPSAQGRIHLKNIFFSKIIDFCIYLFLNFRKLLYIVFFLIFFLAILGINYLKSEFYAIDDIQKTDKPYQDLIFFEKHFGGVLPLEIIVDTQRKKGAFHLPFLREVEALVESFSGIDEISQSVSVISLIKAMRQAFYEQNPDYYALPDKKELPFLMKYLPKDQVPARNSFAYQLIDSLQRKIRISLKVTNLNSKEFTTLIQEQIQPRIEEHIHDKKLISQITGTTLLTLKGNVYLVNSLGISLLFAILIITGIITFLFRSWIFILIVLISNILPLLMTFAFMALSGIFLSPGSVLIFSIAFGIVVDDTIHFLIAYKQGLREGKSSTNQQEVIKNCMQETGRSLLYTSVILTVGFIVFVFSHFNSTIILGVLTSLTICFAVLVDLLLLPALLLDLTKTQ